MNKKLGYKKYLESLSICLITVAVRGGLWGFGEIPHNDVDQHWHHSFCTFVKTGILTVEYQSIPSFF